MAGQQVHEDASGSAEGLAQTQEAPEVLAAELLNEGGEAVAGDRVRHNGGPRVLPAATETCVLRLQICMHTMKCTWLQGSIGAAVRKQTQCVRLPPCTDLEPCQQDAHKDESQIVKWQFCRRERHLSVM